MQPRGDLAGQRMAAERAARLLRNGRRVSETHEQSAAEKSKKVAAVEGQGKQAPPLLLKGFEIGIDVPDAAAHRVPATVIEIDAAAHGAAP